LEVKGKDSGKKNYPFCPGLVAWGRDSKNHGSGGGGGLEDSFFFDQSLRKNDRPIGLSVRIVESHG